MVKKAKAKTVKKPERVLPKFKLNTRWVMIVEYRDTVVNRRYQKVMFKIDKGGYKTASKRANEIARSMGRCLCETLEELDKELLCRVVAVYADDVFQSWTKEVGVDLSKTHVKEAIKMAQPKQQEYAKIKKIGVR